MPQSFEKQDCKSCFSFLEFDIEALLRHFHRDCCVHIIINVLIIVMIFMISFRFIMFAIVFVKIILIRRLSELNYLKDLTALQQWL